MVHKSIKGFVFTLPACYKDMFFIMPKRLHLVQLCRFFYDLKSLEPGLQSAGFLFCYVCLRCFGAHLVFTPFNRFELIPRSLLRMAYST